MLPDNSAKTTDTSLMSLSAFSIQGKRNHMEDYFDIGYQMKACDQQRPNEWPYEYFYFGIFDGHGGNDAASFAKQNLLKYITSEKEFWSNNDEDVKRAIRNGFAATHAAMKRDMPNWPRTNRVLPSTAGTTASVLFIRNGKFYTGHVGDSRIIICNEHPRTKAWITDQLTEDHKPESRAEVERIERAGGEVKSKIGVHRVVWRRPVLNIDSGFKLLLDHEAQPDHDVYIDSIPTYPVAESLVESYQTIPFLAIARSLGDFWSINPHSGQYVVSPEPDVMCRPITSQDKCILLATDGLWNVIHSSMAVRILQELDLVKGNRKQQHVDDEYFVTDNFYDVAGADQDNHALSLVYYAYQLWERRRLRSDNITVVVAMLHDILSYFHKPSSNPYPTRASAQHGKETLEQSFANNKLVQIRETYAFQSEIRMNTEPNFIYDLPYVDEDDWQRLEKRLVLPPTLMLFEKKYYKWPKVVEPKNFERLKDAPCRSISIQSEEGEIWIQIKNTSDDPADEKNLPIRVNKSGKEVKDCSAQATQSMHDFGIPWSQLCYERRFEGFVCDDEPLVDEDETFYLPRLQNEEGGEVELEVEEEEEEEEEVIEDPAANKNKLHEKPKKEEKSIPQLRCLLNRTPPLRRSSRHTYLSVSDNAKRKFQVPTSAAASKSKRRKSQPVRCSLARV